jgi:hypothetical protein
MADESYPSITTDQLPLNDTIVDWDNDGMVIMEDGKGFVTLYNNNDGIFFQVLIKDRRLQQQMLRQGLVVYVDPNGKKKKKYSVQFPTLAPPKRGERPQGERRHRDGERRFNRQDTVGMFGNIQQQDPRDRQRRQISKEEREKMLKRLIANVASQPATFLEDDEETILSQESAKVFVSGNNVVFTAYIPYDRFDKIFVVCPKLVCRDLSSRRLEIRHIKLGHSRAASLLVVRACSKPTDMSHKVEADRINAVRLHIRKH